MSGKPREPEEQDSGENEWGLSDLRGKDGKPCRPIAIVCADIHLTLHAPPARAIEDDWLEAQARPLQALHNLAAELEVPIICAGDIFDKWSVTPELINWATLHLPTLYAIPGQHDLPYHDIGQVKKSGYWTLTHTGNVHHLQKKWETENFVVIPFPFGREISPCKEKKDTRIYIALAHQYVWRPGRSFEHAPDERNVMTRKYVRKLQGYDVAVFGDNHIGFVAEVDDCSVFNCGSLQKRKIDQIRYKPMVGVVYSSGYVDPVEIDSSEDRFVETRKAKVAELLDIQELVNELQRLGGSELDFAEAVHYYLENNSVSSLTKEILLETMG